MKKMLFAIIVLLASCTSHPKQEKPIDLSSGTALIHHTDSLLNADSSFHNEGAKAVKMVDSILVAPTDRLMSNINEAIRMIRSLRSQNADLQWENDSLWQALDIANYIIRQQDAILPDSQHIDLIPGDSIRAMQIQESKFRK
jgi:hypothetical protein